VGVGCALTFLLVCVAAQVQLMLTEGVVLEVEDEAIREVARVATVANKLLQNIGARRLQTIVERVMESISFDAPEMEVRSTPHRCPVVSCACAKRAFAAWSFIAHFAATCTFYYMFFFVLCALDLQPGTRVVITKALVEEKASSMLKQEDLSKYIL